MHQKYYGYNYYMESGGCKLYTAVMLPSENGKFPVVIKRSPYVNSTVDFSDDEYLSNCMADNEKWLRRGYAVVFQHCRGRGKSNGECEPFINEREDGLNLQNFIRNQKFYNGEIFLWGGSYCCEVHYATAPFAPDIKGAVFRVRDTERYSFCYRNGFFKTSLFGDWFVSEMYRVRNGITKNYSKKTFDILPLKDFSKTVYGEAVPVFDEFLKHPDRDDPFWNTHLGGGTERFALRDIKIPVLIETSWYDIFEGGIFDMWQDMSENAKTQCAFVVSAYDHPDNSDSSPIPFPDASRAQHFGAEYDVDWCDYVLGKRVAPIEPGKVTYYNLFLNKWTTDDYYTSKESIRFSLGDKAVTYTYNPFDPPSFPGGLSSNFGGVSFENPPDIRYDILHSYTSPFEKSVLVKGNMTAKLTVSSDCEDTAFYIRISITKDGGDYGLREDIHSISEFYPDYKPGDIVEIPFTFDEHAFLIKTGERLRVDIASADDNNYVRHTNLKGHFSEQTNARVAHNTVYLDKSVLDIPIDEY